MNPFSYSLVAICGFCVDLLIYAILFTIGISVYLANAVGFFVGAIVNVLLIRAFIFVENRFRLGQDILLTIATNGAMLVLGMALLWILVESLFINPYLAKLIANSVTFALNYVTRVLFFGKK